MGVGGALIDAVLDWTRSRGARRVLLDVAEGNQAALALYRRKGFVSTGIVGNLPEPREHIRELQMELPL
jgi:ribosomal protein S18 acetylase RimI-like enzyme